MNWQCYRWCYHAITTLARASTASSALPIATPVPAASSILISLKLSPKATTFSASTNLAPQPISSNVYLCCCRRVQYQPDRARTIHTPVPGSVQPACKMLHSVGRSSCVRANFHTALTCCAVSAREATCVKVGRCSGGRVCAQLDVRTICPVGAPVHHRIIHIHQTVNVVPIQHLNELQGFTTGSGSRSQNLFA